MDSRGFAPLAAPGARALVLGSLPGQASIAAGQYYAQPRNAFWRLMGELFDAGPEWPYAERVRRLGAAGVAVWDVCRRAYRAGSLDAAIVPESVELNAFAPFLDAHRGIAAIYCNGLTAYELYRRRVRPTLAARAAALPLVRLPSTSPAHAARRFDEKLAAWRVLAETVRR